MPVITILLLGIPGGMTIYAGMTHLLIGAARRPRDATHLYFGLTCLTIAAHTMVVLALQTAPSLARYVAILKYAYGPSSLAVIVTLIWFVACFTDQRSSRWPVALSLWFAVLLGLHLRLPYGILYAEISGLRQIRLPWNEVIVLAQGTPHRLQIALQLFYLGLFAFFGIALVRQDRRGHRRSARLLGLALTPLLVARVVDPLIVLGAINSLLTTQFAFVAIVIAMSLMLSHTITQTEHELHTYQQHLQDLVADRTAELARANTRLAEEIQERTVLDLALQRRVAQLTALKQVADIGIRIDDLPVALQQMSEIVTSLFDARSTLLLIPATDAMGHHLLLGFERGVGTLGPDPANVALDDLPLAKRVLIYRESLLIPALHTEPLPPAVRAFITARRLESTMLVPLAISGSVLGILAIATDQPGRTFSSDEVSLAETIAGDMTAAIDTTRLYQRAVAARERLTLLHQASQALSQASLDSERIYAALHMAVARLMPTDVFAVLLVDDATHEADVVYLVDHDDHRSGRHYLRANEFANYMLRRNASVRIDEVSALLQHDVSIEPFRINADTESGVAALLRGSERAMGIVVVQSTTKAMYHDHDEEALQVLAAHAAVALENAQRYQQARALAASAERSRLARELHDSVTQTIYSASLLTEALPAIWRRDHVAGERDLSFLRQLMRGALAELRTLLFELRPAALAAANLSTLLQQLGDRLTGNNRIPVALTIDGAAQLPPDVKLVVYRIAQEAFNNIAKHAGATQVWVTLRAEEGQLWLSVRDDGRGFDGDAISGDHMGLRIMAERASSINARLGIDSTPRHGTEVSLRWPDSSIGADDTTPGPV